MISPAKSTKAPSRPPKAKFAMTGIVTGFVAGMVFGFVVEMASKPSPIFMQVGGIIGIATGGLVESARYWWRARLYRGWQKRATRVKAS